MKDHFASALAFLFAPTIEGGFSNRDRRDDPGGATNRGITQAILAKWRGHPVGIEDVRRLGEAETVAIYRAFFWNACRCDDLPWPLALAVFNGAVLSGEGQAKRWLQRALRVTVDGNIGPVTLAAADRCDVPDVLARFLQQQQHFNEDLGNYEANKNGWTRRLFRLAFQAGQPIQAAPPLEAA